MTSRFSCDYRGWTMLLAAVVWLAACCPGRSLGQTTSLPPPAASSLDRLAQAPSGYGTPLSPPPPTWDPFAPQATQLPPQQPAVVVPQQPFANSAMGGQPGYPGYSTTAPNVMPTQGTAGQPQQYLFPPGYHQQN